jgi:hypothetical protein
MTRAEAEVRLAALRNDRVFYAAFADDRSPDHASAVAEWTALNNVIAQQGPGGPTVSPAAGGPREAAQVRIDALVADRAFYKRLRDGDPAATAEWQNLNAALAGLPT